MTMYLGVCVRVHVCECLLILKTNMTIILEQF